MNNQPKRKRGLLTSLAAVATAAIMALSAAPAQADPLVDIDPEATATLQIHKSKQPDALGNESTGLDQGAAVDPMENITFTAKRVDGINLTTNAGWEEARTTTIEEAQAATGTSSSKVTDAAGLAKFESLPLGLYLVTETEFSDYPGITPAAPFLVTLPMTHPTELNTWLYDVHVYPKNSITDAAKTVQDAASVKIGDDITWTIKADIPKVEALDGYKIVDVLDAKLEYVSAAVSLTGAPGVTLDLGDDYTVTPAPASTVAVEFTETGRAKLVQAWQNDPTASQVQVVITTEVLQAGEIKNTATVYPNLPSFDIIPGEPGGPIVTPEVETKFGSIVLEKVNAKDTSTKLKDAVFQVFASEDDAKAKANPININGKTDFASNDEGIVVIEGLRFSNFADGVEVDTEDENYRSYWIVETKAPTGYELLAEPVEVHVTSTSASVVTDVVKNVLKNAGFQLPLTGASGASSIIMVAGFLLLIVGTAAVVVSRRKRAQA